MYRSSGKKNTEYLTDDADEPAEFDQEDFEKGLEAALEENLDMDVDEDYLEHGAGLESPDE